MSEFNPHNPADVWIQKHKRKAAPLLFVAIPGALWFMIKLLRLGFENMSYGFFLFGIVCIIGVILACANLLDEVTRLEKRVKELEGRD